MASDGDNSDDVKIIKPSTKLKDKVGGGTNAKFNAKMIERTEKAVEARSGDYLVKVRNDIESLRKLIQRAQEEPENSRSILYDISMGAREVKGEAATFNYPLLTRFGDGLYKFTESMTELTKPRIAVIQAHIDAMNAVLSQRMKGDGGPVGNQLSRGLEIAVEKFRQE
jgi:hypothetical protein